MVWSKLVQTEQMVDVIKELDATGMEVLKIEDDRGGSGAWVFTIQADVTVESA